MAQITDLQKIRNPSTDIIYQRFQKDKPAIVAANKWINENKGYFITACFLPWSTKSYGEIAGYFEHQFSKK